MDAASTLPDSILSTVSEISNIDISELNEQTNLFEIGLDSMGRIAILSHLHARYGVACTEEETFELFRCIRIGDIVRWAGTVIAKNALHRQ
jgi:acyl carrier protein